MISGAFILYTYIHTYVYVYMYNVYIYIYIYIYEHYGILTRLFIVREQIDEGKSRVPRYLDFKIQPGPVAKMQLLSSGWESNPKTPRTSTMLCQLSYGGRCREYGHEFSICEVVMSIK